MLARIARVVVAVAAVATGIVPAWAERRLALVIGVDHYEYIPTLQKAANDARAMTAVLSELGFDVLLAENPRRNGVAHLLDQMDQRIVQGDTVFFFFAGHGFEIEGQNFLLPSDVPLAGPGQQGLVRDSSFAAQGIIDRIRNRGAGTVVAVLDACRNNPFAAVRGVGRALPGTGGLAQMTPDNGVFIVFSAGAKQEALDRLSNDDPNPNSVFTRVFVTKLRAPGLSLLDIVKQTQVAVSESARRAGYQQTPAYYDQVIGEIRFRPNVVGSTQTQASGAQIREGESRFQSDGMDGDIKERIESSQAETKRQIDEFFQRYFPEWTKSYPPTQTQESGAQVWENGRRPQVDRMDRDMEGIFERSRARLQRQKEFQEYVRKGMKNSFPPGSVP